MLDIDIKNRISIHCVLHLVDSADCCSCNSDKETDMLGGLPDELAA